MFAHAFGQNLQNPTFWKVSRSVCGMREDDEFDKLHYILTIENVRIRTLYIGLSLLPIYHNDCRL